MWVFIYLNFSSHGELYVVLSRERMSNSIKILVKPNYTDHSNYDYAKSIVYMNCYC